MKNNEIVILLQPVSQKYNKSTLKYMCTDISLPSAVTLILLLSLSSISPYERIINCSDLVSDISRNMHFRMEFHLLMAISRV